MMRVERIMQWIILLLPVVLLYGCSAAKDSEKIAHSPNFTEQKPPEEKLVKRFQQSPPRGPTVVESAIELSEKYAKLSQEAAQLRQQNQDFMTENQQLKKRIALLQAQLQQTEKELEQANDLLIEMRVELNNWKSEVLGFRDEIRAAEKAQLEALLKILKLLGGEVKMKSEQTGKAKPAVVSSDEPATLQTQELSVIGEPNE